MIARNRKYKKFKNQINKTKKTQNIQIAFYNIMLSISHWDVCAFKTYDTLINLKQGICKKVCKWNFMYIVNEIIRGNADLNLTL